MTIKTPEDDEFDRIARESGWRKQQIAQQATLQEKYDEAIYLLRETQQALKTCTVMENDDTDAQWYYFNEVLVDDVKEIIDDYLKQNG